MNRLQYSLFVEENCKKALVKAGAKNPEFRKSVDNKIKQILENPYRFKPLRAPMQNKRRVHIMKSFVLVYEIIESQKSVRILDFDHHDNIYKR